MLKPISNPDIGVVYPNSPLVCWYVGVHHFILWSYGHKGLEYDLCTLTLELSIHNKLISYMYSDVLFFRTCAQKLSHLKSGIGTL